jgi:creatinine amidohydrolase/Fe(II)-dependent formamide hydrolase-like protein
LKIGREVVTLYDYLGKVYFLPAAEQVKKEAQVGMDKASADAEKATQKVSKSLDNLAK